MLEYGKAICYSGYREGQCPWGEMPTKQQIAEDLMLLVREGYRYLRMYDPNDHARTVLELIRERNLPLHYGTAPEQALEVNQKDFARVSEAYPDKFVVFTELGWSTKARDDHKKDRASEAYQKKYISEITEWFAKDKIIGFIFEAFDEPWKGEAPDSCERNWGLFYEDRTPKPAIRK